MKIEFKSIDNSDNHKNQRHNHDYAIYIDNKYYSDTPCFSLDNSLKIYGEKEQLIKLNIGDSVYRDGVLLRDIPEHKEKSYISKMITMGKYV